MPSQVSGQPLVLGPVHAQVPVEHQGHLGGDPGLDVDAVGDVADRHVLLGEMGIQGLPHPPRDHAVQGADAVGVARELEGQHGHAERLVPVADVHPAQPHEVLVREVQPFADLAEVLLDQTGGKAIVTGGDRRVRGEDGHPRHLPHHLAEGKRGRFHHGPDHLDRGERAMPLVEMEHRGIDVQRVQGADAAHPQEQLLADPDAGVAAVEPARQGPVRLAVLGNVRVQQQERRPPHLHPPDPGPQALRSPSRSRSSAAGRPVR